jgi:hypothetical protein
MLTVLTGIITLVIGSVISAAATYAWTEWRLRQLVGERMIVTVAGDLPFVGYLTHRGRRTYIFETCHTLPEPGATAVPIAGRIVIDRPSIAYMQHVVTGVDLPAPPNTKAADVSQ